MCHRALHRIALHILANSNTNTMWWSAWTCSSSIKSNIQCQIGFKFIYSNNVSERSTSPSPSPSPSPPSLETEQMSFHINSFRFSAQFYALVVIQPTVDGWESISLQQKLSAHSKNFNRATNMLNGNIKHNVFYFLSSYFTVYFRHFFFSHSPCVRSGVKLFFCCGWGWITLLNFIRDDNSFARRQELLNENSELFAFWWCVEAESKVHVHKRKVLIFVCRWLKNGRWFKNGFVLQQIYSFPFIIQQPTRTVRLFLFLCVLRWQFFLRFFPLLHI